MAKSSAQLGLGESSEAAEARIRQACFPLVQRIKDGQIKLWERWRLIMPMPEGTGKDRYPKGWDEARGKLYALELELEKAGYRWCFYFPPGDTPRPLAKGLSPFYIKFRPSLPCAFLVCNE